MGGDDGFRPMFELRRLRRLPCHRKHSFNAPEPLLSTIERTPDCPVFLGH